MTALEFLLSLGYYGFFADAPYRVEACDHCDRPLSHGRCSCDDRWCGGFKTCDKCCEENRIACANDDTAPWE